MKVCCLLTIERQIELKSIGLWTRYRLFMLGHEMETRTFIIAFGIFMCLTPINQSDKTQSMDSSLFLVFFWKNQLGCLHSLQRLLLPIFIQTTRIVSLFYCFQNISGQNPSMKIRICPITKSNIFANMSKRVCQRSGSIIRLKFLCGDHRAGCRVGICAISEMCHPAEILH